MKDKTEVSTEKLKAQIIPPLRKWFQENKRELPWRSDPTPYHVWLSEIMLQQTRVEAVKEYYARFLQTLPTVESLAKAPEDQLLKLWEGLGYYSRVRNLQKAARVLEDRQYILPDEKKLLLELPGIGSYTAGAIASIAFGKKETAVDGNLLRVLSRLREDPRCIDEQKTKSAVEAELLEIYPEEGCGDCNQAFMDLGATVCVPGGAPLCHICPLKPYCKAGQKGTWKNYPVRKAKAGRKIEDRTIIILVDEDKIALHKRPDKGLLAGLYEFINLEGHLTRQEVLDYLGAFGLKSLRVRKLADAKHIFSHIEWHMIGYEVKADELEPTRERAQKAGLFFAGHSQIREQYPIPSAYGAYRDYVLEQS
ncbi:MAG: A/G-specific adenine glycosylase [Lachnospiraceae bacterium]|nr:A/G-specific adenine glycosylase [Lachnospiraceae bacterium]